MKKISAQTIRQAIQERRLIIGLYAVQAAIERSDLYQPQWVLIQSGECLPSGLEGYPVYAVSGDQLNGTSVGLICAHHGIESETQFYQDLNESMRVLMLDHLNDPHNLGACIRSAYAAGVDAVIIPKDRACAYNTTVRKVASGAAEKIRLVEVVNLARTCKVLKDSGLWIYGLEAKANQGVGTLPEKGFCLIAGGEHRGLGMRMRQMCDGTVGIPMKAGFESLNVSVAVGIALFAHQVSHSILPE